MSTLYDRIIWACNKRGVTPSLMCDTIGIRRAFVSELKTREEGVVSYGKIAAIANYLRVSTDFLIFGEDNNGLTVLPSTKETFLTPTDQLQKQTRRPFASC